MKLPAGLSGQDLRRALERDDFVFQRQKGSHMILRREDPHECRSSICQVRSATNVYLIGVIQHVERQNTRMEQCGSWND